MRMASRIVCLVAALTLSGCMGRSGPVARVQPQGGLDALAYGAPARGAPLGVAVHAYDAAYRLDAGDRLRVVVYGQEGLTNSYAIDAGGSITITRDLSTA